jgi:hypothetical protein
MEIVRLINSRNQNVALLALAVGGLVGWRTGSWCGADHGCL